MKKLFIFILLVLFIGCSDNFIIAEETITPKYHIGQLVTVVLTGERGMVINTYCASLPCAYNVRLATPQNMVVGGMFSEKKTFVSNHATVFFYEVELSSEKK